MSQLIDECGGTKTGERACENGAQAACEPPLLTVIVPVYNEAATVNDLLRRVVEVPLDMQVMVVDDGSTDGTTEILEEWEGHPLVELLAHARNRGKGAAIRTGLEHARGRYTIVQDADLEYDPRDFPRLLAPLLVGAADVVFGSRYMGAVPNARPEVLAGGASPQRRPPWSVFRAGVCALNVAVRCLYGARLTDEATCYKLFSTDTLRSMGLECERFEFCPEVTAKSARMGLRIAEVAVCYCPRGVEEGKKIGWRDGVQALATLWRLRNWNAGRQ